jgi:hypothetical protein
VTPRPLSLLFVVAFSFLFLANSPCARAYDKSAFIAPEGKALIVFVQNQRVDRKMSFLVFESDKRCVAQVGGREAQIMPVEPMPLLLYVSAYYSNERIEIYPEAGRTYFVRLHTIQKPMGQVATVTPVRRASDEHKLLKFHLEGVSVTQAIGDDTCYGKPLDERKNRTQRRINAANADWKNEGEVYRDKNTLIEHDGLTKADIELF